MAKSILILAAAMAVSPAAFAQGEDAQFGFETPYVRVQLTPVAAPVPYACDAPATSAKVDISQNLALSFGDSSLLSKVEKPALKVKVRRGGQVQPANDDQGSPAKFSEVFHPQEQMAAASDMALRATLFFCNYESYLAFAGIAYDLAGRIGNVTAHAQQKFTDALDGKLSLKYERGNWKSTDGRQFFPQDRYLLPSDLATLLGALHFTLGLKDLPVERSGSASPMPITVVVSDTILILDPGAAP